MTKYCFSCYDRMQFQIMGSINNSQAYIEKYQQTNESAIKCDLCERKVEYQKQPSGKWLEVEIEE